MPTGVTEKTEQIAAYRINRRYRMKSIRKADQKSKLKETIKDIVKTQHIK